MKTDTHPSRPEADLWKAYRDALLRFIRARVSDRSAAEDLVQEVLLKAHTRRNTLKEPSRLRAWLYQITRNEIIDYYRARKPEDRLPDDLAEAGSRQQDQRAQQELARCLLPFLGEVPEPYRQALTLADFEGVRQQQVADRLGISLSATKSRVQRGRRKLKELLLKCCRVELDRRGHVIDYEVGDSACGSRDKGDNETKPETRCS